VDKKVSGDSPWIDRRMALAKEWDDLGERIRRLEGFADFLRPPPLDTLLGAADRGPVVIVNVSRWRCDALVVTSDGVDPVELPGLTANEVSQRTDAYLRLLRDDMPVDADLTFATAIEQRAKALRDRETILRITMEWLWDVLADPVLTYLGFTTPPSSDAPWPRIWWCPTGLLTLLPLHGAGYHAAANGQTVLDRVVSSYTPTLRALRGAMKPSTDLGAGPHRLLFVGVPDTPDHLSLTDDVATERAFLQRCFRDRLTVVEGSAATRSAVRTAISNHQFVHLSCHGYQDLNNPSAAGLLLSDGTLTITQFSADRYGGEFAFLSACRTATGGLKLPDETIALAAALSYTGYRHVLATLWSVDPAVAIEVTEAVYPKLIKAHVFDPADSALALHDAIRTLREAGRPLDDWLPFTHTGL
jgi:hypothetical protein